MTIDKREQVWRVFQELRSQGGPYPKYAWAGDDCVIAIDSTAPGDEHFQVDRDTLGAWYIKDVNGYLCYDMTYTDCFIGGYIEQAAGSTLTLDNTTVGGDVRFYPHAGQTEGRVVLRGTTTVGGTIEHAIVVDERQGGGGDPCA